MSYPRVPTIALAVLLSAVAAAQDGAATGDLDVTDELQVNGAGAETTIIDGVSSDRLFDVLSATFAIRDVTIRDGEPPDVGADVFMVMGGGIRVFGCGSGCTVRSVPTRRSEATEAVSTSTRATSTRGLCRSRTSRSVRIRRSPGAASPS